MKDAHLYKEILKQFADVAYTSIRAPSNLKYSLINA